MPAHDLEIEFLRAGVNCAAVLETMASGWRLDRRQSTRQALKFRRGKGEILILNHDGRGWWDPTGPARGDVFDLVQHLDPSLNFGQVRQVLRRLIGVAPSDLALACDRSARETSRAPAERWARRPGLCPGSAAWGYLADHRALPRRVLETAAAQDAIREGRYGSAWFAHREGAIVSHVEVRGPDYKGSLTGGRKTLFRLSESGELRRLVIAEAPIDALSVAALEGIRPDTLYIATGGGMGPGTIAALQALLNRLAAIPDGVVESAADANTAGDRYAARQAELATAAGVRFARLRPPDGLDWNDVVKQGRAA